MMSGLNVEFKLEFKNLKFLTNLILNPVYLVLFSI